MRITLSYFQWNICFSEEWLQFYNEVISVTVSVTVYQLYKIFLQNRHSHFLHLSGGHKVCGRYKKCFFSKEVLNLECGASSTRPLLFLYQCMEEDGMGKNTIIPTC